MIKIYSLIQIFMSLIITSKSYLPLQSLNIFIKNDPIITIKNETDNEICGVTLEKPNKWPPRIYIYGSLLPEKIEVGGEAFIPASPGEYDIYIVDCSERIVFEELNLIINDDKKIIIKEPQGRVLINNDSQDSICYISLKMIRERNQQPYYMWPYIIEIQSLSNKQISIFPGTYTIRISNCDGKLLSSSEKIKVTSSAITNIIVGQISKLKVEYDKDAGAEICFFYINSMTNPSIGDDFLSANFILPGEIATINLPEGEYKILIKDCHGKLIFQKGNILIEGDKKQEIYVPFPHSLLKFEEPKNLSVCELYVSTDIKKFLGEDLSSQIQVGIPLAEGYYDIQVNLCKDYGEIDIGYLDEPIVFEKIYITGEHLLVITDPRPWIVRFASEDPGKIPWMIGILFCGLCGFGFLFFLFIIFFIFRLRNNRRRSTQ